MNFWAVAETFLSAGHCNNIFTAQKRLPLDGAISFECGARKAQLRHATQAVAKAVANKLIDPSMTG
jgi:hypothetical protein